MKSNKRIFKRRYFLVFFFCAVLVLYILKNCYDNSSETFQMLVEQKQQTAVLSKDTVLWHAQMVDSIMHAPRNTVRLIDKEGKPVKNRVTSVSDFKTCFPDVNPIQLATAEKLGINTTQDRDEAHSQKSALVYVGDNPYFTLADLTHSIPYLVPRASLLLEHIGRAFIDSLSTKGLPFHKIKVTSVLRTQQDVQRLRRHNKNATENSCHLYGTTFDISYNEFEPVNGMDGTPKPMSNPVVMKSILAEVLEDLREQGLCYVKYEYKQSCFHITAR